MNIPQIQIRQTYAQIHIDGDLGKWDIRQPRPDVNLTTKPAKLDIRSPLGEQTIDQSQAWEALGKGDIFQFTERVASEAKQLALQGIGKRVEAGNQMAAIHQGGNAIAELAFSSVFEDFKFNYEGPFGTHNYQIQYTPKKPEVKYEPGDVQVQVQVNAPQISYTPGKLEIYLKQRNSIEIIPPQVDVRV
ncbi:DUF6470 family protein [Paenibacillus sp. YYML68]|uniref:DUF6470 family protein n=1 Tax=Paenibacillus sp. YYML68 TaxID=2909250 RepID=UPI00248FA927|nr:DUF6470 family protein [Paenibacillus sp. YYML68]